MLLKLIALHLGMQFSLALGSSPDAGQPVSVHAKFRVVSIEKREATCEMFTTGGVKTNSKSMMPPGCVVTVEPVEATTGIIPQEFGKSRPVYLTGALCKKNSNDFLELFLHRGKCNRVTPGTAYNRPYCDIKDFEKPESISDEKWACMIGNLWSRSTTHLD